MDHCATHQQLISREVAFQSFSSVLFLPWLSSTTSPNEQTLSSTRVKIAVHDAPPPLEDVLNAIEGLKEDVEIVSLGLNWIALTA